MKASGLLRPQSKCLSYDIDSNVGLIWYAFIDMQSWRYFICRQPLIHFMTMGMQTIVGIRIIALCSGPKEPFSSCVIPSSVEVGHISRMRWIPRQLTARSFTTVIWNTWHTRRIEGLLLRGKARFWIRISSWSSPTREGQVVNLQF